MLAHKVSDVCIAAMCVHVVLGCQNILVLANLVELLDHHSASSNPYVPYNSTRHPLPTSS
jgi:hypothetical protein